MKGMIMKKISLFFVAIFAITICNVAVAYDSSGVQAAQKYSKTAKSLRNQMAAYEGAEGAKKFRQDSLANIAQAEKQLEKYRAVGQVSDAEYLEAQKSMERARTYLNSQDTKQLNVTLALAKEAGEKLSVEVEKCEALQGNEEAYSACVQSAMTSMKQQ